MYMQEALHRNGVPFAVDVQCLDDVTRDVTMMLLMAKFIIDEVHKTAEWLAAELACRLQDSGIVAK